MLEPSFFWGRGGSGQRLQKLAPLAKFRPIWSTMVSYSERSARADRSRPGFILSTRLICGGKQEIRPATRRHATATATAHCTSVACQANVCRRTADTLPPSPAIDYDGIQPSFVVGASVLVLKSRESIQWPETNL